MPSPYRRDQLSPAMIARYGLDRRPVGTIILIAILVIGFIAALIFVGVGLSRDTLQFQLLTWRVAAPDHVSATFEIKRQTPDAVTCVLRAQDDTHSDVGYAPIFIERGDLRVRVNYELRTLAPAYIVEVVGCSIAGSPTTIRPQFPPGVVPPDQPWVPSLPDPQISASLVPHERGDLADPGGT